MFGRMRNWFDRRILARSDIGAAEWYAACAVLPVLDGLSGGEKRRLVELAILFLHRKVVAGARGLEITPRMKRVIALQACLPILELGLDCYAGWESVIVYPSGFAPERLVTDEYGVEHHVRDELSGEAWEHGPVLLSWDDIGIAGGGDGYNLVIHEFAHKLDMQNGDSNGFPPLHRDMNPATWTQIFSAAFTDFERRCDHGEDIGIDEYAAESPAEFFAVLSEVFFERPDLLDYYYPAVYAQMKSYYRQDPLARMRGGCRAAF
jgi:Mlc titration factor MtfA (ptsG expression regulator)